MSQPVLVRLRAPDEEPRAFTGPTPAAAAALAVMPERVRAAFERLASCDGWSEAAWAVRSAVLADRRVDDPPEATDADGMILWRTVSRRTYITRRHDYDDPPGRPVSASEVDRAVAAAVPDVFDDPPPS